MVEYYLHLYVEIPSMKILSCTLDIIEKSVTSNWIYKRMLTSKFVFENTHSFSKLRSRALCAIFLFLFFFSSTIIKLRTITFESSGVRAAHFILRKILLKNPAEVSSLKTTIPMGNWAM